MYIVYGNLMSETSQEIMARNLNKIVCSWNLASVWSWTFVYGRKYGVSGVWQGEEYQQNRDRLGVLPYWTQPIYIPEKTLLTSFPFSLFIRRRKTMCPARHLVIWILQAGSRPTLGIIGDCSTCSTMNFTIGIVSCRLVDKSVLLVIVDFKFATDIVIFSRRKT